MRLTKHVRVGVAAAAASLMLVSACGGSSDSGSTSGTDSKSDIRMGWIMSLSGQYAVVGQSMTTAMNASVKYINANGGVGGRKIVVTTADDKSDASAGVAAAKTMITSKKIDILVGVVDSTFGLPVAQLAEQNKMPFIAMNATVGKGTPQTTYTFQVAQDSETDGTALAGLAKKIGVQRPVIIHSADAYEVGTAEWIAKSGVTPLASEQVDSTKTDFTAAVTKILAQKPDAVFMLVSGQATPIVISELKQLGFKGRILSDSDIFTAPIPTILKVAGDDALDNAVGTAYCSIIGATLPASNPHKAIFDLYLAEYLKESGGKADPLNNALGWAWDGPTLVKKAFETSKSDKPEDIRNALEAINGLVGLDEIFNFTPTDHLGMHASDMCLMKYDPPTKNWAPYTP